jgi:hypothetical protein
LETVLAAHETTVSSLQYLRCHYSTVSQVKQDGVPDALSGQLTRGPNVYLLTVNGQSGFGAIYYYRPGHFESVKTWTDAKTKVVHTNSLIAPRKRVWPLADPLLDLTVMFSAEAYIGGGGGLRDEVKLNCKPEAIEVGDEVHIPYARSVGAIRLSKRNGHLVVGSTAGGDGYVTTHLVTEFGREPNGVQIPIAGSVIATSHGKPFLARQTKLSRIDTSPFDEASVRVRYPRKTSVVNSVEKTEYTVDEGGNLVGDKKPHVPLVVGAPPDSTEFHRPTDEEPPRAGWWLAPAGCSVLAMAVAVRLYVRNRRRRDAA